MAEGAPLPGDDHDTLKYHLLGPSLTKAGQDTVDQQKVSEIIYNASKGSKFFNNEELKDRNLTQKISRILERKRDLERSDLGHDLRRADDIISGLELSRDLSQIVIHIDCDAFYAAVEELDRPELKDVPMAVGKGVLTTCNYHARRFGCRSGMAGFVAMKLCPELICLPLNFDKYVAKAQEVRAILADYDARFESASIDEAYLNITKYCEERQIEPDAAVEQLRGEIAEKTKITISAGIAPNAKLAKIASNRNKPNGQFRVANDRNTVMAFMRDLPVRKVNGVGRVFERELDAIGIRTCGDIFEHRALLAKLFGDKAFHFLINCYLGLGRTDIQPAEEYTRKSVGTERTFREMATRSELHNQLRSTAEELERDLARTHFKGRTLVLKIKLHTYEVLTRQVMAPKALARADDIYDHALPMLNKLEKEIPDMKLRLMGLRMTHLVSSKRDDGLTKFFRVATRVSNNSGDFQENRSRPKTSVTEDDGSVWEAWPEEEFEEAERQENETERELMESLSQEHASLDEHAHDQEEKEEGGSHLHGRLILPNPTPSEATTTKTITWDCPICSRPQPTDERDFNAHIDYCLSRSTIKEAIKETSSTPSLRTSSVNEPGTQLSETANGDKRSASADTESGAAKRQRLFFISSTG
ncbi:MAG: hypothetical protein M1825_005135 [Sarcosagium campestre]|nr:MAG: hypothetical protein M1825_005135 [Sarcosagium campestre]